MANVVYIVKKDGKYFYTYSLNKAKRLNSEVVCRVYGRIDYVSGIENLR